MPDKNVTISVAAPIKYTASFYDGTTLMGTVTVKEGEKINQSQIPSTEKAAKRFDGWYNEATFVTLFDLEQVYQGNTTAYGKWSDATYTITKGDVETGYTLNIDKETGVYHETVTITVSGDSDYRLIVKDSNGNDVAYSKAGENQYTVSLECDITVTLKGPAQEYERWERLIGDHVESTATAWGNDGVTLAMTKAGGEFVRTEKLETVDRLQITIQAPMASMGAGFYFSKTKEAVSDRNQVILTAWNRQDDRIYATLTDEFGHGNTSGYTYSQCNTDSDIGFGTVDGSNDWPAWLQGIEANNEIVYTITSENSDWYRLTISSSINSMFTRYKAYNWGNDEHTSVYAFFKKDVLKNCINEDGSTYLHIYNNASSNRTYNVKVGYLK